MENRIKTETPRSVTHKKRHAGYRPSKILFIPFFLFFLGISILAGRYLYTLKHKVTPEANTPISTSTQTNNAPPKATPQIATGWQIYKNTADQFSFSYPSTLGIKVTTYGLGVTQLALANQQDSSNSLYQILTFPKLLGNYIGQNFDTYYAMQNGATSIIQSTQQTQKQLVTKIKNTTVNGLEAVDITTTPYPVNPNVTPNTGTYIEIGNNVIVFLTSPQNANALTSILATFQYPD